MTRASTMLLALLVLNVLMGVLCLIVGRARGQRKSSGLWLWGLGTLVYSLGILITIPTAIPFDIRKVIGNALIAYSPILTVDGALRYAGSRLDKRWTTAGFVVTMIPIVLNHLRPNITVLIDITAPSVIANVLFLHAAFVLLRRPPADARGASQFLSAIFTLSVIVWTTRVVMIWAEVGATNDRDRADLTIALFAIAQMVMSVSATLGLLWIEVRNMQGALQRLADTDMLTGIANRRATVERFDQELERAARYRREFAIVLFDIDSFKNVNDTHGHGVGDAALRHVSELLKSSTRNVDVVGRIGGEEFIVVLTEEGSSGAMDAANRLRQTIAESPLEQDWRTLQLTVSGGVAVFPADGESWDRLYAVADHRLYAAKNGGRNRVEGPSASPVKLVAQHEDDSACPDALQA